MSTPSPVPTTPTVPGPKKKGEVICWDPPHDVKRADFLEAVTARSKEVARDYTAFVPKVGTLTAFNRAAAKGTWPFQKADRGSIPGGYESRYLFFEALPDADKDVVRRKVWKLGIEETTGKVVVRAVHPKDPKDPADVAKYEDLAKAEAARLEGATKLAQEVLTQGDVNKFCYHVLRTEGGCFPLKDRASFFFVPDEDRPAADFIERLMEDVKGSATRLDVPETTGGARLAKQAVEAGMSMLLHELRRAVEQVTEHTRADTMEAQLDQVGAAKIRIEALHDFMGASRENLLAEAGKLEQALKERLNAALKRA